MKKLNKKDWLNICILSLIFLLILFSFVGIKFVNGSTIDWSSQHWLFPEYFRNLFYDTKEIFPSFAFNIGGGQNIYYLSYYGLLNPLILPSYLLPFVPMYIYIQLMIIVVILISIILMYKWLNNKFNNQTAFIGTLIFLLASPLIYHTHRHIMFINYIPFLLMGLIAIDNYFSNNKKTTLVISVFLIIMTSYYYSVVSMFSLVLYALYKYLKEEKTIRLKKLLISGSKIVGLILIGVMLSAVLIMPTFYALINGRFETSTTINWLDMLIPQINITQTLYDSYTIGLTSILLLSMFYSYMTKKRENILLASTFLLIILFPIIMFIFSGFMYTRGKVLIPLLPIAVLLVSNFIYNLKDIKFSKKYLYYIFISVIFIVSLLITKEYVQAIDILLIIAAFFSYFIHKKEKIFISVVLASSLFFCLSWNHRDILETQADLKKQVNKEQYKVLDDNLRNSDLYRTSIDMYGLKTINRVNNINYYLPSIYSSSENKNYLNFINREIKNEMPDRVSTAVFSSQNILFNTLMGVKYYYSENVPIGYQNIGVNTYVNDKVLPLGYASSNLMSLDEYNSLSIQEKYYALVSQIIVDKKVESNFTTSVIKEEIDFNILNKNINITKKDSNYIINSPEEGKLILEMNKTFSNEILFISFSMNYSERCRVGNTSIIINGVKNTLSCKTWLYHNNNYNFNYVISSNEDINQLEIEFSKGKYVINNIELHSLNYDKISSIKDEVSELVIDKSKTKGDVIVGNINVKNAGYFILTVPFDKGFTILLNDKKIDYEIVNKAFIGFKVNEGEYTLKVEYKSPHLNEGKIVSSVGVGLLLLVIIFDRKKIVLFKREIY